MIRKLIFFFFLGIFSCQINGQDSLAYSSKWQVRLLVGKNIPVTKLLQGAETDYLFQYDDNSYYNQILSLSYFFHKHWGFEVNYQAGTSSKIRGRGDKFLSHVQSEYNNEFYVNPSTGAMYDDHNNFIEGDISRGLFGVIYRLETSKFYVYPKFSIGITSFYIDWGRADLKEKNSNLKYKVAYSSGKSPNDYFTLAPSVSFGYKIVKRVYFNADIMYSYFRTNIVFEKKMTNLYTAESSMKYFDYKKNVATLSLGAGLIVVINP